MFKHLALTASFAVIVLAVLRIFFFSGFSIPVGLTVLNIADRASVLASTLLLAVIAFLPIIVSVKPARKWLWAGNESGASVGTMIRTAMIWMPLSVLIFGVASVLVLAGLVLGSIVGYFLQRWMRKLDEKPEKVRKRTGAAMSTTAWVWATLSGIILIAVLQQSWMPIERIEVKGQTDEFVGYVVGDQAGFTLLLDRMKIPTWILTADILHRDVCSSASDNWVFMTIPDIARSSANLSLPRCPTVGS